MEDFRGYSRRMLAILMEKLEARDEFRNVFSGIADVAKIFPEDYYEAARWILASQTRISPNQLEQKLGLNLLADVAGLHAYDLAQSALTIETFKIAYQRQALREMGMVLPDDALPEEYIQKAIGNLTALSQLQSTEGDPRADRRLLKALETFGRQGPGYKPFGIPALDRNLPGIDFEDGDLIVIFGPEKSWKTRLTLNIILRLMVNNPDLIVSWISTEPMSTPEKVLFRAWAMLAVRCAEQSGFGYNFDISPLTMHRAEGGALRWVNSGKDDLAKLGQRLFIHGPTLSDGNSAALHSALSIIRRDITARGASVVVIDNFQQFTVGNMNATDYEVMLVATREITQLISQHRVVCLGVSQIGQSGRLKGGGGMTDRLNLAFKPHVEPTDVTPLLEIECAYAREAPSPWKEKVPVFPFSGWIKGAA